MNKIVRILINSLEVLLLLFLIIFNFNFNNVSAANEINIVNDFSYKVVNGEATITGPIGCGIITEIPSEIDGYPVTKIGYEAFLRNDCYYEDLIIPEGVREIETRAFYDGRIGKSILNPEVANNVVHNITIPKSVTKIELESIGCTRHTFYTLYTDYGDVYWMPNHLYLIIRNEVIRGYKGTAAETYAKENGITFIALDDEPTTTAPVTTGTTTETTVVTTQTTAVSSASVTSSVSATSTAETTTVMTTVTTPDVTENVKGDANGDGKLTANDAAFIAKALAEASINSKKIIAENYWVMDFNQDGKVTAKDAADIARYLAEQSIT